MARPMPAPGTSVQGIINQAAELDLAPCLGDFYRGAYRVTLSGHGSWAGFGGIVVGARSGRILRSELTHGLTGPTYTYDGHLGAHAMLRAYAEYRATTLGWWTPPASLIVTTEGL